MPTTMPSSDEVLANLSSTLQRNLENALRVAGSLRDNGKPPKLRSTDIHRRTGLARSTLHKLIKRAPLNPDLATLCKLAWTLQIPVPFLLMSQADWNILGRAIHDHGHGLDACAKAGLGDDLAAHDIARKVLAKGYQTPPPMDGARNLAEHEKNEAANERLHQCGRVLFSLILQRHEGGLNQGERTNLMALAANLANYYSKHPSAAEHLS